MPRRMNRCRAALSPRSGPPGAQVDQCEQLRVDATGGERLVEVLDRDMPGTPPRDPIVAAFESHRERLRGVAYRVLGSHAGAEDALQLSEFTVTLDDAPATEELVALGGCSVGLALLTVLDSLRRDERLASARWSKRSW